jgi:hypothetical protein
MKILILFLAFTFVAFDGVGVVSIFTALATH